MKPCFTGIWPWPCFWFLFIDPADCEVIGDTHMIMDRKAGLLWMTFLVILRRRAYWRPHSISVEGLLYLCLFTVENSSTRATHFKLTHYNKSLFWWHFYHFFYDNLWPFSCLNLNSWWKKKDLSSLSLRYRADLFVVYFLVLTCPLQLLHISVWKKNNAFTFKKEFVWIIKNIKSLK